MKSAPIFPTQVLLVDDNRDGLVVRKLLLEELGCEVAVAANGEEGLKLCAGAHFDVVVTDYRMPRMSGADFIQRLRKIDAGARIILLSGFVEPLGLTEENTGADVVIAKSSREPAHLTRWIKRLSAKTPARKPPSAQTAASARARSTAAR